MREERKERVQLSLWTMRGYTQRIPKTPLGTAEPVSESGEAAERMHRNLFIPIH